MGEPVLVRAALAEPGQQRQAPALRRVRDGSPVRLRDARRVADRVEHEVVAEVARAPAAVGAVGAPGDLAEQGPRDARRRVAELVEHRRQRRPVDQPPVQIPGQTLALEDRQRHGQQERVRGHALERRVEAQLPEKRLELAGVAEPLPRDRFDLPLVQLQHAHAPEARVGRPLERLHLPRRHDQRVPRVLVADLPLEPRVQSAGLVDAVQDEQQAPLLARLVEEAPARLGAGLAQVGPGQRRRGPRVFRREDADDVADPHQTGDEVRVARLAHGPGQQLLREGRLPARRVADHQQGLRLQVAAPDVAERLRRRAARLHVEGAVAVDADDARLRRRRVGDARPDARVERDLLGEGAQHVVEGLRVRELAVARLQAQRHALLHDVQVLARDGVHDRAVVELRRRAVAAPLVLEEPRAVPGLGRLEERGARDRGAAAELQRARGARGEDRRAVDGELALAPARRRRRLRRGVQRRDAELAQQVPRRRPAVEHVGDAVRGAEQHLVEVRRRVAQRRRLQALEHLRVDDGRVVAAL